MLYWTGMALMIVGMWGLVVILLTLYIDPEQFNRLSVRRRGLILAIALNFLVALCGVLLARVGL